MVVLVKHLGHVVDGVASPNVLVALPLYQEDRDMGVAAPEGVGQYAFGASLEVRPERVKLLQGRQVVLPLCARP